MKNMITGASQDDVDLIMDPADGYFTIATAEHTANLCEKYHNDVDPESTPYNIENDIKEKEKNHDGNEGINAYELLHALPLTPQNFKQH